MIAFACIKCFTTIYDTTETIPVVIVYRSLCSFPHNGAMIRNHVMMTGLLYYFQLKDNFKFLSHLATTILAHGMLTQICSWKQSATSFVLLQRLFLLGPGFLNLIPGFLRQICWVHRERKLNLQFSNFKLFLQSSTNKNSNPPHPVKSVTIS